MPTFQRSIYTTWLSADQQDGDGATPTYAVQDEGPVHALEAKRRRDEERRQRLEKLDGPKRAPRTTRRP